MFLTYVAEFAASAEIRNIAATNVMGRVIGIPCLRVVDRYIYVFLGVGFLLNFIGIEFSIYYLGCFALVFSFFNKKFFTQ